MLLRHIISPSFFPTFSVYLLDHCTIANYNFLPVVLHSPAMRNIRRIYFPLLFLVLLTTGTTIHAAAVSTVINGIQTTIAPTATPATLTTETNSLSPKEAHDRNIILTAVLPEFTNINHVRNTAQSLGVGIDSLVRFRDDTGACELLLGTGSPDLSGIGVSCTPDI